MKTSWETPSTGLSKLFPGEGHRQPPKGCEMRVTKPVTEFQIGRFTTILPAYRAISFCRKGPTDYVLKQPRISVRSDTDCPSFVRCDPITSNRQPSLRNPYSSFVFYSTLRLRSILPWEFLVNHEVQSDINRTTRTTFSLIRMRLRGSSNRSVLTTFHSIAFYSSFSR